MITFKIVCMKTKILFLTALCSMIVACAKENSSGISKQSVEECQNVIAFDTHQILMRMRSLLMDSNLLTK